MTARSHAVRSLAAIVLSGCALTSKGAPEDLHYFSPEPEATASRPAPSSHRPAATIRLGRVTSSASLRARIARRESAVEMGLYETRRWTDDPEVYVRRGLTHELFDAGAFGQGVSGSLPTLDVEVVGFEEVQMRGSHTGRVVLHYELHDDRTVLAGGVVTVERPVAGAGFDAVVVAIGGALAGATAQIAEIVGRRLSPVPAPPAAAR